VTDIYAIGDCAEVDGQLRPYLLPAQHGAKALAATLTGTETAANYPAMPVDVKTPAHPVRVLLPSAGVGGAWRVEASSEAGTYAAFLGESGAIAGYVLSGDQLDREDRLLEMLEDGAEA
jgi:rubredoxin-NAD+ reductase